LEAKSQLQKLVRLQELALEIRKGQRILEAAPERIDDIEERFRERNAEYVAIKDRHDELDVDQRARSGELGTLEEHRKKFMDDLMQVKNQREYAALLKEIDSVKAQISEHEEAILTDMEEIEKVKADLTNHEEHIQVEREAVGKERADVESEATAVRAKIEQQMSERDSIAQELPGPIRTTVQQLEANRQGVFLSKTENGTCLSCFVRVRPQVFQEIRTAVKVHRCSNCNRFLYHEPSLTPATAEPTSPQDGIEAINGGAV